jgi:hypothetical protein
MTATKDSLQSWVLEGLVAHGGRARLIEVAKHIWEHHEADLRAAGDLFYSWQYDIRWAATALRKRQQVVSATVSPHGIWEVKR